MKPKPVGRPRLVLINTAALQGFRMDLRDWPESEAFPDVTRRPVEPDWLADYLA